MTRDTLETAAALAAARGVSAEAARLLACAAALRDASEWTLGVFASELHDATAAVAHAALSEAAFREAWTASQAMSYEQIVAYGLQSLD